ncbi:helix-turn-helix domain-containing protein [Zhongshania sp.]|uniref:AraC family transcriptional regulator n=1 Tax=Zhongshania sp. TaxID=1971902 RepID=UPI0035665D10
MFQELRVIASVYRGLISILREEGLSSALLSEKIGINVETLTAPLVELSLEQVTTLWELGYGVRGPKIGIDAAKRIRLVDFQDIGVFLTATENVGELLKQLDNYSPLFSNVMEINVVETLTGIELTLSYNATVPLVCERLDFLALSTVVLVSQYLDSPLCLSAAESIRQQPIETGHWDNAFGVKVKWGAKVTRLTVARSETCKPVLTRNEQLKKELQLLLNQRLRKGLKAHPADEIRTTMMKQMVTQVPTINSVADAMHISPRTLQRRLSAGDASFSDLLLELRKDMAKNYITLGLSTSDIAERLGYTDVPSFNRAFKRWEGMTPSQYSKRLDK